MPRRIAFALAAVLLIPHCLSAHGGGLDSMGCHHNRKQGGYHCHRGPLAGRYFDSKAEAQQALRKLESKPEDKSEPGSASQPGGVPLAVAKVGTITPAEAKNYVGETSTVCGKVASARYAVSSRGQPTFLNLGQPYPNQVFTVVIWGDDRPKFGKPEIEYENKQVCVTGRIE